MPHTPNARAPRVRKKPISTPVTNKRDELNSTLESLYQDGDGTVPDMTHFEKRRDRRGIVVTFFILFFMAAAAAAAWLGFFLFSPTEKFSEEQVEVTLDAPTPITAGVPATYHVSVKNTSRIPLATTQIALTVPDGFVITHALPGALSEKNERWLIGALDPQEQRSVELTAVWGGVPGTAGTIRAVTTFRPSNFNADFEKVADTNIALTDAPIILTSAAGTRDTNDTYTVTAENISDTAFPDARLTVALPGFQTSSTEPKALIQNDSAVFEHMGLEPHTKKSFVMVGKISDATKQNSARVERIINNKPLLVAQTGVAGTGTAGTPPPDTSAASSTMPTLTFVERSPAAPVKPGDAIDFTLTFVNGGSTTLSDITFTLTADTPSVKNKGVFDYTNLNTNGTPDVVGKQLSPTRRRATITWTSKNYSDLANVAAGTTLVVPLHLTAKSLATLGATPKETRVTFSAAAKVGDTVFSAQKLMLSLAPEFTAATSTAQ